MIAPLQQVPGLTPSSSHHERFSAMIPQIQRQARRAFRALGPEAQEELLAETVANAFCAFQRLVERGREAWAYASPLAQYAIRQIRSGRRVGRSQNVRDVSSRHAQRAQGITVERLDQFDRHAGAWREVLVEDKHAGPAEIAASRIDVAAWFRSLARRKRQIAESLAHGETTGHVAQRFGLSAARVSQLRQELRESWDRFQGLPATV